MNASFVLIAMLALAAGAKAQSVQVVGYSGELGEWELTATASGRTTDRTNEFAGPLTMRHVGICTQDGPEEKSGEIRLRLSKSRSEITATLLIDGVECRYSGRLAGRYIGLMNCPERQAVPLTIWLKE